MRLLYIVTKIKLWHNILYLPIDFMNKMWYHIKAPTRYAKRKIGTALQGVVLPVLTGFLKCATAASASSPLCLLRRDFVDLHQGFFAKWRKAATLYRFCFLLSVEKLAFVELSAVCQKCLYFYRICTDGWANEPDFAWAIFFTLFAKKQADPATIFAEFSLESPHGIWMFGVFNITW